MLNILFFVINLALGAWNLFMFGDGGSVLNLIVGVFAVSVAFFCLTAEMVKQTR